MEDFQFIIYLIIGAIYIISRVIKGNNKNKQPNQRPPRRPQPTQNQPQSQTQKPKSFEDILAEFGKRMEEQVQPEVIEEKKVIQQAPKPKAEPQFEEGRTRRFADEESKRIYEEAIVRSEGADIKFEANEKFKTPSLKMGFAAYDKEEEENEFAKEIRESLSDSDSAKKAVILSEILNRKY